MYFVDLTCVQRYRAKLVTYYEGFTIWRPLSIQRIVHHKCIDTIDTVLVKLLKNLF